MNKLTDYIVSLTHLYGIVHKDKVREIYNMQNKEHVDEIDMVRLKAGEIRIDFNELDNGFVEISDDYFVHESILEFDKFDRLIMQQRGKPFYIPEQEELLKYKSDSYFEENTQYKMLLQYIEKNIFHGDSFKAQMLGEDIQMICQYGFEAQKVVDTLNLRGVDFKNVDQANEVMKLVMDLANNTRIWENNGHTPTELFEKDEKSNLRPLPKDRFNYNASNVVDIKTKRKMPRNDPCPCGSGKKYKKCCLGK